MPNPTPDQPKHSKRGDGFPGDTAWNHLNDRFRATLAKLARDKDPEARAAADRITTRATSILDALVTEATKAQAKADHERALLERERAKLKRAVNRLGHTGHPLPPSLAALVNPPEAGRDGA
ncbi:hypothetical protein ACGFZG_08750 [Streptomyces antibioticus]|uniref:hypothetical protein n=1 Tax=Streptomyces antibioticus TaxID=1890 RepID=UPI0037248801